MAHALTPTGERMLNALQAHLRRAHDVQAVMDVAAREVDRFEESMETVRRSLLIQGAEYLRIWEHTLGLTVDPVDRTETQRLATVHAYVQSLSSQGTGLDWEEDLTRLIGSGWSYEEHDPADAGSPPPNTIRIALPYSNGIAAPSGLTATPSGTGGTLPQATYFYVITAINSFGETTISNRVSAATGAGSTNSVTLDWTARDGATGYRIYRSTTSGSERFLAEVGTVTTYGDTGSASPDMARPYPVKNTTKSPQAFEVERLARRVTPSHLDLLFTYNVGFIVGVSQIGEEAI